MREHGKVGSKGVAALGGGGVAPFLPIFGSTRFALDGITWCDGLLPSARIHFREPSNLSLRKLGCHEQTTTGVAISHGRKAAHPLVDLTPARSSPSSSTCAQ